jgi:hypothetical protein
VAETGLVVTSRLGNALRRDSENFLDYGKKPLLTMHLSKLVEWHTSELFTA